MGDGQFVGDPAGAPLVLSSPRFDDLRNPCGQARGVVPGGTGTVYQPALAVGAVAGHPRAQEG